VSDTNRSDDFIPPEIQRIVRAFEKALRGGENPSIDAHLTGDGANRLRLTFELVHSDLELRLRAGEPRELAEYLARYPELAQFPNELAKVLETEVEFHTRADRKLVPAEYEAKYPQLGRRVRELFRRVGDAPPEVPGYEVGDKLGEGGMGVVYRARQELLRRDVALKVIRGDRLGGADEAAFRARFRREAEAAGSVNHPNVVQVYETGDHEGDVFLAMELVDGPSLQDRLDRDGVLAPREAAALMEAVSRAVHAVHGKRIVHRDLKPANVLLTADGTPKVTDFGLARPAEVTDGKTRAGAFVGTPEYSSPEQASATGEEPTARTDVYGLGAVLYASLAGRAPFPRDEVLRTLEKVRSQAVVPVRELRPDCPRDLETICLKCLEKDPSRRYASAADLADDLRRWQAGEPIVARPVGRAERAWKWVKRNPVPTAAAIAATIALALGGVALDQRARRATAEAGKIQSELDAQKELSAEKTRGLRDAELSAARLAFNRGQLRLGVTAVDAAVAHDPDIPAELRLERVKALLGLNEQERFRTGLAALDPTTLPPALSARWHLLRGEYLLGEPGKEKEAEDEIKAASAIAELTKPEKAFADGLLAKTAPDAHTHFAAAYAADPLFLSARLMDMFTLFSLGRMEEVIEVGRGTQLLYPNDPQSTLVLSLAFAFRGRTDEAKAEVPKVREQLGPEIAEVLDAMIPVLAVFNLDIGMDSTKPKVEQALRDFLFQNFGRVQKWGEGLLRGNIATLLSPGGLRLPPSVRPVFEFWFATLKKNVPHGFGNPTAAPPGELAPLTDQTLSELRQLCDKHPESGLCAFYSIELFSRAMNLFNATNPVEVKAFRDACAIAAAASEQTYRCKGYLTNVRLIELDTAILMYAYAGWSKDGTPHHPVRIDKAMTLLRERLALRPFCTAPPNNHMSTFIRVPLLAKEYGFARMLLDDVKRIKPDDPNLLSFQALIDVELGAYESALKAARECRERKLPDQHKELDAVEKRCLEHLSPKK
jgi:predicted Ser/Thr protein kinase